MHTSTSPNLLQLERGALGVLLLIFVLVAALHARALPPMEGSDEPLHYTYSAYLRSERTLPPRTDYLNHCTRQQSGQPPLMYALGALLLDIAQRPTDDCAAVYTYYYETTANAWRLSPNPNRLDDNKTNFFPVSAPPPPAGLPASLYWLRGLSVAFGVFGVLGAYYAAMQVFSSALPRLLTAALFAFTPTLIHISAYFTNDSAAIAFSTWALAAGLAILRHGASRGRLVWLGGLLGLGGLSKASVLLLVPALGLAILFALWRQERRLLRMVGAALWVGTPMLLTVGVWMAYGLITYGDALGTGTHIHPTLNYNPPQAWDTVIAAAPQMFNTYIGLLGYANVPLPAAAYITLAALTFGALGLAAARRSRWSMGAVVLAVAWLCVFAGFLHWFRTIYGVTGRLMLPVHIALVLGVVAGVMRLPHARARSGVGIGMVAVFVLCSTFVSLDVLQRAYRPQLLRADELPPLQGNAITFDDTVTLIGYTLESATLTDGTLHPLTLCWQVLAPTERLAAYSVRYVKDGVPVATRTTVHGLGRYNSTRWQIGDIFCDRVDMPIGDARFGGVPPQPATSYDILVVMLDAPTQDVNWQAYDTNGNPVQFPILGQVTTP